MMDNLENIIDKFLIVGNCVDSKTISNGLINTTYYVEINKDGEIINYIFQKINKYVFKKPEQVMENIYNVTEFIRAKIKSTGKSARRRVMHCILTKRGRKFYLDENGNYWRCYFFIDEGEIFNYTEDEFVISELGKAFGEFLNHLSDFDSTMLYETIPDFHNTAKRYKAFEKAVNSDICKRCKEAKAEIEYLIKVKSEVLKLGRMQKKGLLPTKVIHNDTKCNNVMFDKDSHKAMAVLDLDTVMPGLVAYDFGDAVRFICNTSAEDEKDVSKTSIDLNKYNAFSKGFLSQIKKNINQAEKDTLALGAYTMTIELAVRFLTDYLLGDGYFKTNYEGHNLVRARCQIALAKDMKNKRKQMENIIKIYC